MLSSRTSYLIDANHKTEVFICWEAVVSSQTAQRDAASIDAMMKERSSTNPVSILSRTGYPPL